MSSGLCPIPADKTVPIVRPDGGAPADAGAGCTEVDDLVKCEFKTDCVQSTSGFTSTTSAVTTTTPTSITGTQHVKTVIDATGSVFSDCTYGYTMTKQ